MKTLNPKAGYIVKNGTPTALIMPIAEYEELLEDLHDHSVALDALGFREATLRGM